MLAADGSDAQSGLLLLLPHLLHGWMTERVGRFSDNLIVLHNLGYFHEIFVSGCVSMGVAASSDASK